MQVLVVGATGTLGRQIARQALDAGHQVRCMVRTPRKASFLQEWGCELTRGDLLEPASLDYALEGMEAVIDASTSRPDDPRSVYETDWDGKLNLLRACDKAGVKRFVFLSLLAAAKHRQVPLMDIKYCTEQLLQDSEFDYTILQGAAFMQGVIGQFAIPVLDSQTVWVSGSPTAIAYMNTQDLARLRWQRCSAIRRFARVLPWWVPRPGTPVKWCNSASDTAVNQRASSVYRPC